MALEMLSISWNSIQARLALPHVRESFVAYQRTAFWLMRDPAGHRLVVLLPHDEPPELALAGGVNEQLPGLALTATEREQVRMLHFPAHGAKFAGSREITKCFAPSFFASACLEGEVLNTVTSAPIAFASFTAMCPNPPRPTMPTFLPFFVP